ncbi:MAG TPA: hypothetical protein VGR28_02075 [Candidatus Thermoplasmatota archaeon]|jgi:hypothetical protein|nr:hypothetical protein [Candidatus Thermoplasmatota archaeon]
MKTLLLAALLLIGALAVVPGDATAFRASVCVVGNVGSVCTPAVPVGGALIFCTVQQTPTPVVVVQVYLCV